jgi:hypothetical protein
LKFALPKSLSTNQAKSLCPSGYSLVAATGAAAGEAAGTAAGLLEALRLAAEEASALAEEVVSEAVWAEAAVFEADSAMRDSAADGPLLPP